jgi:hypothetical protein
MENQEGKEGEAGCCAKTKCCGKALAALALLAVGGLGGYLAGRCCPARTSAPAATEATAK